MSAQNLTLLRKQISSIDTAILNLLEERMKLVVQIGRNKKQMKKPILDTEQEDLLLSELKQKLEVSNLPIEKTLDLWKEIFQISRDIQQKI